MFGGQGNACSLLFTLSVPTNAGMSASIRLVPTLVVSSVKVVGLRSFFYFFISSVCNDCLFLFLSIPPLSLCVVTQVDMSWLVVWYFGRF